ncbi:RNA binding protein [Arthrobacter phage Snek]|uniref:RNA binding protein n=1 Tax=Arthrobacter phage Tweety19 TaxID=2768133 RepID=A0A7G9W250_9CAUD|nr:RNA binding protein [Arthrobacter phage Tweety19]QNO12713.1 RNA binding protein [Arthrobacter phage Tweety19]
MSRRARVTRVFVDSYRDPMSEVLSDFNGEVATVTLRSGRIFSGRLECVDGDNYEVRLHDDSLVGEFHRDEALALRVDEEATR